MTGLYLRIKRNGKYENVELEYLTEPEIAELFANRPSSELLKWLITCVKFLKPVAQSIDKFTNESNQWLKNK